MTEKIENRAGQSTASNVYYLSQDNKPQISTVYEPSQDLRIAEDPTMQRAVSNIYSKGERFVLELLSTLAEKHIQALAVEQEIKRFALLPKETWQALGFDKRLCGYVVEVPND